MPEYKNDEVPEPEDRPSKSERKRQVLGLQKMGESLLTLNDRQLAQIPIDDEPLLLAIRACRQIRSHGARKRHLQYIGKLMRSIDTATLGKRLLALHITRRT